LGNVRGEVRLFDRSIAVVKKLGLKVDDFSGHSLRAGS
jgi:hypothetical protein